MSRCGSSNTFIYHYYLAKSGITHGPNPRILGTLRATYEHVWRQTPGYFDGASLMPDGRILLITGCNGAGTGKIEEVQHDLRTYEV